MKLLIVDDDQDILKMITRLLAHRGHVVQSCTTPFGVSAMVLRETPDVVLLDVMMPGLTGPALAEVIRQLELSRRPQLVLWSAMDDDKLRQTSLETALPTLSKTLHPTKIIAELEKLAKR
jgi:DNA-binding response OmpR family regulator